MRMIELHIETRDMQRAVAFYTELLNPAKTIGSPDSDEQVFLVLKDGFAFGIWRAGYRGLFDGLGADHLHYAFQIPPSEYEHWKTKLQSMNLEISEHMWKDGHRSLYFFDPDGHQGEFITKDWLGRSDS